MGAFSPTPRTLEERGKRAIHLKFCNYLSVVIALFVFAFLLTMVMNSRSDLTMEGQNS